MFRIFDVVFIAIVTVTANVNIEKLRYRLTMTMKCTFRDFIIVINV